MKKSNGNGIGRAAGRIASALKVYVAKQRAAAKRAALIAERKARAAATPALTNLAKRPARIVAAWLLAIPAFHAECDRLS